MARNALWRYGFSDAEVYGAPLPHLTYLATISPFLPAKCDTVVWKKKNKTIYLTLSTFCDLFVQTIWNVRSNKESQKKYRLKKVLLTFSSRSLQDNERWLICHYSLSPDVRVSFFYFPCLSLSLRSKYFIGIRHSWNLILLTFTSMVIL